MFLFFLISTHEVKSALIFQNPVDIQNFYPNKGILAGNTTITITGQNISFEGPDRYNIEFCDENNVTCIECRLFEIDNAYLILLY